jgi:hypothetical protein
MLIVFAVLQDHHIEVSIAAVRKKEGSLKESRTFSIEKDLRCQTE